MPATVTVAQTQTQALSSRPPPSSNVTDMLTLRLVPKRRKQKAVRWAEDVVDNEELGKKKSKKCCIFHKQRKFGDWSDEDIDSDTECERCQQDS